MGQRIPAPQRLAILADAIVSSAPSAAERAGVSAAVIWKWAEGFGGLRAVRELYEQQQAGAVAKMALAISDEISKRLPHLSEKNVIVLALEALGLNKQAAGGNTTILAPMAQAQAQAKQGSDDDWERLLGVFRVLAECGAFQAPIDGTGGNGAKDDGLLPPRADG